MENYGTKISRKSWIAETADMIWIIKMDNIKSKHNVRQLWARISWGDKFQGTVRLCPPQAKNFGKARVMLYIESRLLAFADTKEMAHEMERSTWVGT